MSDHFLIDIVLTVWETPSGRNIFQAPAYSGLKKNDTVVIHETEIGELSERPFTRVRNAKVLDTITLFKDSAECKFILSAFGKGKANPINKIHGVLTLEEFDYDEPKEEGATDG